MMQVAPNEGETALVLSSNVPPMSSLSRYRVSYSATPGNATALTSNAGRNGQCKAAGLSSMHGLRHAYVQARYLVLTGWKAPAAVGPSAQQLTPAQRGQDRIARQTISRELGHERLQITTVYLGR
jgi:integrase